jgi:tetratricopeptide (TPR) repeat protein
MDARDVEDAFFRYEGDLLELSERALSESPCPRLYILRAGAARVFGLPLDPLDELAAARELPCDPVDASLISCLEVFITQGPHEAVERLVEHAAAFPDDLFGAYFRFSSLVVSGVPGYRGRAMALVESDADRLSGDWRFDTLLAVVREEQRRYDEARTLADRALDDQPECAPAAHVIAHVNYETGEHTAGIAWLDEWRRGRTPLFYGTHFPWHNALHALALGDIEAALARFRDEIGPAAVIDAGSLLWRCRLANADVHDNGAAAAVAAAPVLEALPTPFAVFNACLALAAAGDAAMLAAVSDRLEMDTRPAFADLIAPIARGFLAMVDGRPDDTVALMEPLLDDLPRLGGSDAQREAVEDTLLRAFVAAGRAEEAEPLLRARLERRPHALDCQLLEIVRAGVTNSVLSPNT